MLSTKNISTEGSASGNIIKPVIEPGQHFLKINKVYLKPENKIEFGVKLILEVETKPVDNLAFKGFTVDGTTEVYKGQIGKLEWSKWGFKDFLTNSGIQILKEEEILKAVKTLCNYLNIGAWFEAADEKYPTIEAFVEGFNSEAPFKGIFAYYCVGGREFLSKDGKHINHQLQLPREERLLGPPISLDEKKVQKFFYSQHVESLKNKIETSQSKGEDKKEKPVETNQTAAAFLEEINMPVEQTYGKDLQTDPNAPVKPKVTSQAEANFMNEGKSTIKTETIQETPFTDSIEKDAESTTGIVTSDDQTPLPWEL